MISVFNRQPQQISVRTNCDQESCAPIGVRGTNAFVRLGNILRPQGGAAAPMQMFSPVTIPSVAVIGSNAFYKLTNNFLSIKTTPCQLYLNNATWGADSSSFSADAYATANVSVGATGTTAIPVTLNADKNPTGVASQRTKIFATLANIRVPDDVYKIVIGRTGAAGPIVENLTVEFTTLSCREVGVLAVTTAQRYLSITDPTAPVDRNSYSLFLPASFNDTEAPGSGGILTLDIACFDSSGAQVAATVTVETWDVRYGDGLLGNIIQSGGIPAGGDVTIPNTRQVDVTNTQLIL